METQLSRRNFFVATREVRPPVSYRFSRTGSRVGCQEGPAKPSKYVYNTWSPRVYDA